MREFTSVDELRAHYLALKRRTSGLSGPTGVVPPDRSKKPPVAVSEPSEGIVAIETNESQFLKLLQRTAVLHHIHPDKIRKPTLHREVVRVRQELFYRAYNDLHFTQQEIGRLAGVNHSTVNRGIKAHKKFLAENPNYA